MKFWKLSSFNNFRYFERKKRKKHISASESFKQNLEKITYENCDTTQMKIYDTKTKKILIKNYSINMGKFDGGNSVSLCIHSPYHSHEILKNSYNWDTYLKLFRKNCKKCYTKLYDPKNKANFEVIHNYNFQHEDFLLKTNKPKELVININDPYTNRYVFILTKEDGIQPKNNRFYWIS